MVILEFNESIRLRLSEWTASEDSVILLLRELGMDEGEIATHLTYRGRYVRTEGAVKERLKKLENTRLEVNFTLTSV